MLKDSDLLAQFVVRCNETVYLLQEIIQREFPVIRSHQVTASPIAAIHRPDKCQLPFFRRPPAVERSVVLSQPLALLPFVAQSLCPFLGAVYMLPSDSGNVYAGIVAHLPNTFTGGFSVRSCNLSFLVSRKFAAEKNKGT